MLDTEESCSRAGVLKRVPEEELSTPEEFLAARSDTAANNLGPVALVEDDEESQFVTIEQAAEEIPSESTPLLTKDGVHD